MITKPYTKSARNKKYCTRPHIYVKKKYLFMLHHLIVSHKHKHIIFYVVYIFVVIYKLQLKTNTVLSINIHQNQCLS